MRKFVRRNRVQVAAASLIALALLLGIAGTTWQAMVASDRAVAAKKAEKAEKTRADELKQVSDFQEKMLAQVDPTAAGVRLTEDVNRRLAAALEKDKVPEAERAGIAGAFGRTWAGPPRRRGALCASLGNEGETGAILHWHGPTTRKTHCGHFSALERLLHHEPIHRFLDGVTAAVVGLIGATAVQVTLAAAATPVALVIFAGSVLVLFATKSKWATPALIVLAALIAGGVHVVSG